MALSLSLLLAVPLYAWCLMIASAPEDVWAVTAVREPRASPTRMVDESIVFEGQTDERVRDRVSSREQSARRSCHSLLVVVSFFLVSAASRQTVERLERRLSGEGGESFIDAMLA